MRKLFPTLAVFAILFAACSAPTDSEPPESGPNTPVADSVPTIDVDASEMIIQSQGSGIFVKQIGQGDPVLVIHGGPSLDHSYLLPHFEKLAKHHKVIFYDQRTCGKSDADSDTTAMSFAGFVADIEQIRQQLNIDQWHVIAHSWGGLIAQLYGIQHSDKIKSLTMISPMPPDFETWQSSAVEESQRWSQEQRALVDSMSSTAAVQRGDADAIGAMLVENFRASFYNPALADELVLELPADIQIRSRNFFAIGKYLAAYDLRPELHNIQCPTLLIYGDQEVLAEAPAHQLDSLLPNSEVLILEQCGHFPFIEVPGPFWQAINDQLAD